MMYPSLCVSKISCGVFELSNLKTFTRRPPGLILKAMTEGTQSIKNPYYDKYKIGLPLIVQNFKTELTRPWTAIGIFQDYFYMFSDNVENDGGKILVNYIKEHGLGDLWETGEFKNPNMHYQTTINTWIWRYNGKKIDFSIEEYAQKVLDRLEAKLKNEHTIKKA